MSDLLKLQAELKILSDKYGATLATKPHTKFKGKSLRDEVDYALRTNYKTVVKKTLSHIKKIEDTLELPPISDGYAIAYGKTYGLNNKFQALGFTLKKFGITWAWYREVLSDKYRFWSDAVESIGDDIQCIYVKEFSDIIPFLEEAKSMDLELKSNSMDDDPTIMLPHDLDGNIFEVSKWLSVRLKENMGTAFAFRNLKVIKVKRETAKAYCVDAEFFSGITSRCGVCGRELINDISRATGIGPICAEKIGLGRPTMEKAKEVVAALEKLSKEQGTFTSVWIPKSQIKEIIKIRYYNKK
jgi:hypothetical protein